MAEMSMKVDPETLFEAVRQLERDTSNVAVAQMERLKRRWNNVLRSTPLTEDQLEGNQIWRSDRKQIKWSSWTPPDGPGLFRNADAILQSLPEFVLANESMDYGQLNVVLAKQLMVLSDFALQVKLSITNEKRVHTVVDEALFASYVLSNSGLNLSQITNTLHYLNEKPERDMNTTVQVNKIYEVINSVRPLLPGLQQMARMETVRVYQPNWTRAKNIVHDTLSWFIRRCQRIEVSFIKLSGIPKHIKEQVEGFNRKSVALGLCEGVEVEEKLNFHIKIFEDIIQLMLNLIQPLVRISNVNPFHETVTVVYIYNTCLFRIEEASRTIATLATQLEQQVTETQENFDFLSEEQQQQLDRLETVITPNLANIVDWMYRVKAIFQHIIKVDKYEMPGDKNEEIVRDVLTQAHVSVNRMRYYYNQIYTLQ